MARRRVFRTRVACPGLNPAIPRAAIGKPARLHKSGIDLFSEECDALVPKIVVRQIAEGHPFIYGHALPKMQQQAVTEMDAIFEAARKARAEREEKERGAATAENAGVPQVVN